MEAARHLVLRADVLRAGHTTMGHTVEVSAARLLVRAAEVDPPGAQVTVRLSFPHVLEPLTLTGRVVEQRDPHVYERTAAMTIELDATRARDRLAAFLGSWEMRWLAAPPAGEPTRVLVADRSALIREMLAFGVRRVFQPRLAPVELDGVGEGEEAWQRLQAGRYELAIVDFHLPGLPAVELVGRIRRDPRLAGVPVIVISDGSVGPRLESALAGADLFLDKPLVMKDLVSTMEQLVASKEAQA